jgi:hypothetical protein
MSVFFRTPLPAASVVVALLALAACGATEGPLLHARDAGGSPADEAFPPAAGEGAPSPIDAAPPAAGEGGTPSVPMEPPRDPRVRAGMSLHYQVSGERNLEADAQVFVFDLFNTEASEIEALHARGRVVIAYLSAGSFEPWRPDANEFPASVRGAKLSGYPNENWLDLRAPEVRAVMKRRLARAKDKGFDGIFPGALGAYRRETGFPLTETDQLDYDRFLAAEARALGLTPGLSGDFEFAEQLASAFDWAIAIGCFAAMSCERLAPLVARDIPVFNLETEGDLAALCAQAKALGIVTVMKRPGFDAWSRTCP